MSIDADDIVAVGGDLSPQTLVGAYRSGVFPWPIEGIDDLPWFCPKRRAILDFSLIHVPRSLRRELRKSQLRVTVDEAFEPVIRQCATVPRPGQEGTWITAELLAAYVELHRAGYAHSVEVWDESGTLVGGIYGVCVDGVFSAESMFHLVPNASKIALFGLVAVIAKAGGDFIDIQVITPHLAALGAVVLTRKRFLQRHAAARAKGMKPFG